MYTGLQVARDPGVWTVWLGCTLMMVGIYVDFFMSHRRIWVRVENGTVTIGGQASKIRGVFSITCYLGVNLLLSGLHSYGG